MCMHLYINYKFITRDNKLALCGLLGYKEASLFREELLCIFILFSLYKHYSRSVNYINLFQVRRDVCNNGNLKLVIEFKI